MDLLVADLRAEGHDVLATAPGGDAALELCVVHRPDVLVIDYRMPPGPNGLDIAEQMRGIAPDVAVVLYTNYRGRDLKRRAERLGASYLLKGNIRALRRAVREAGRPVDT
ncbi:MAG: Response regulator receiver domain [Actinomycetota bacterium]|nr:Response regulator receiver domain [Actinomycetota bacterium]